MKPGFVEIGNTSPDRPPVYQDKDGRWTYRPSTLGKCIRGLTAARLDVPAEPLDEKSLQICAEGHIHEPHMVMWLERKGWLVRRNLRVVMPVGLFAKISGEVDGVAWDSQEIQDGQFDYDPGNIRYKLYGVECKAHGDKPWEWCDKEGPSIEYQWQLSAYWHLIEFFYSRRLSGYHFMYKRRSDGEMRHFCLKQPYFTLEELTERVELIEVLAEQRLAGLANGFDKWPPCDSDDMFCPWKVVHDYDSTKFDPRMEPLAKQYFEISDKLAELEADFKGVKWDLLKALAGRKKIKSGAYTVSIQTGRDRFDAAACHRDYPDLKSQYTVKGESFLKLYRPRKKGEKNNAPYTEEVSGDLDDLWGTLGR